MKLYREDLRKGFCFDTEYKGQRIEVYLIKKEYSEIPTGKRKPILKKMVWALSYTKALKKYKSEFDAYADCTFYENDVVGFDSNHGWYKTDDDSEQYKHIASALSQAQCYIDTYSEVEE